MTINVKVNPNARSASIVKVTNTDYEVKFKANRVHGEANARLIDMLADYFKVAKADVRIVHGATGTRKVVEISK